MTKKVRIIDILIYMTIFSYLFFANSLVFNLGELLPLKISDFFSIFLVFVLFLKLYNSQFNPRDLKIFKRILLFLAISMLGILPTVLIYNIPFRMVVTGVLYIVRILLIVVLVFLISSYIKKYQTISKISLLKFMNISFILVGIVGIWQLLVYPEAYEFYDLFYQIGVFFPNPDPHINRLLSTYFDPNYLAAILLIAISLSLYLRELTKKKIYFLAIAFYIVIIVLTVSRSGLLGIVVLFAVYFLLKANLKKKAFGKIVIVATLLLLGFTFLLLSDISVIVRVRESLTDESSFLRFQSWEKGLNVFFKNPVFGIGYNMIGAYNEVNGGIEFISSGYGNDSSLIVVLMTTGIFGTFFFLRLIYKFFKSSRVSSSFKALLFASLVISMFNNLLFYTLWLFPFLLLTFTIRKEPQNDFNN